MPDNPTVFISYSHKDEAWKDRVVVHLGVLAKQNLVSVWDDRRIASGDDWFPEIEKAIGACSAAILLISADFLNSNFILKEEIPRLLKHREEKGLRVIPLVIKPCVWNQVDWLKKIQARPKDGRPLSGGNEHQIDSDLSELAKEVAGLMSMPGVETLPKSMSPVPLTHADRAKLPPVCRLPERHRMPYRSLGNGFVGRVSDLWQIHDILRESKTAAVEGVGAVMGTGGLGKTQLAVEYVHRFGLNYPGGVFWIDADRGISTLISQVLEGAKFKIEGTLKEDEQLHELWRMLSSSQRVLVVLDNFPEAEALQPWLPPQKNIYVLVTTRRRDLTCAHINLNFMTPQEGIGLLDSGDRKFGQNAKALVELLGGLPLALELARNYLNIRTDLTIGRLVGEIKKTGTMKALDAFAKNYANELPDGHTKEVAATFRMSWDIASDTAKAVLQAMSLLAPVSVPRKLLKKVLALPAGDIFNDPLSDAIGELDKKLSMINLNEENEPWLHRLISGFVRSTIEKDSGLFGKVADAVVDEMGRVQHDKDSSAYFELEKIIPHADALLASEFINAEQAMNLSNYLRWHNRKWGRYRLAEQYGRQSLFNAEKGFEPGHPSIAICQSNLATVLQDLGELQEARNLLRKALASAEKNYEAGHPFIATYQSNLATVLWVLGESQKAKDLLRKALASDEKSYKPGHPSIAIRQSNLAMVLKDMGELQEAKDLLRKALVSDEKSYEAGHPSIAIRQSNLALVLQDLAELQEAKDLLRKALAANEKNFEPAHPSIARRQSNLALVLQDLGELQEAKDLALKSYETFLNKLGPDHPSTKTVKKNLEAIESDIAEGQ